MRKSERLPVAAPSRPYKRHAEDAMRGATEYLIATGQAERALKAGTCAPSFRLRDQLGIEVALETLLKPGPLILTFYSGSWCPACGCDLQAFESPPAVGRDAGRVAREQTPQQTIEENAKAHTQLKLGFPILSRPRRPNCRAVRRALAHSGDPPGSPHEERHRPPASQR